MASAHNPLSKGYDFSFLETAYARPQNPFDRMKNHGCPALLEEESQRQKVFSFGADLFCPHCHEKSNFYLIEYERPASISREGWLDIDIQEFQEEIMRCPKCGNRDLILEPF
jgi:hypothetical protein